MHTIIASKFNRLSIFILPSYFSNFTSRIFRNSECCVLSMNWLINIYNLDCKCCIFLGTVSRLCCNSYRIFRFCFVVDIGISCNDTSNRVNLEVGSIDRICNICAVTIFTCNYSNWSSKLCIFLNWINLTSNNNIFRNINDLNYNSSRIFKCSVCNINLNRINLLVFIIEWNLNEYITVLINLIIYRITDRILDSSKDRILVLISCIYITNLSCSIFLNRECCVLNFTWFVDVINSDTYLDRISQSSIRCNNLKCKSCFLFIIEFSCRTDISCSIDCEWYSSDNLVSNLITFFINSRNTTDYTRSSIFINKECSIFCIELRTFVCVTNLDSYSSSIK